MTSETLHPNADKSEAVLNKHTFTDADGKTQAKWEVWDGHAKETRVEAFKWGIWSVIKAIKFHQFEQE